VPRARVAVGLFLVLASLAVAAYGSLYIGAIWTSDTSTLSLVTIGGFLLVIAAALMALAVLLLRGGRRGSGDLAKPS
jgi:hypothetical protein